jgi:ABC-type amino acid transport substrate-binding protein
MDVMRYYVGILTLAILAAATFIQTTGVAQAQASGKLELIQKAGKVRVGMAPYAPFVSKNPNTNALEGLEVEVAEKLAKELNVKVELVEATWPTLFAGLHADKYEIVMSGTKRTLQRALAVNFTEPYVSLTEHALVRTSDNINSWADLDKEGGTLCSVMGGAAHLGLTQDHPDAVKKAKIVPLKELSLCGQALLSGQATAWIEDVVSTSMFAKEHASAGLKLFAVPFATQGEGNGYAIAKGDLDFLNWLNIFITKMKNTGEYKRLAAKYGLPETILVKGWGEN